uniref:Uncharacterized protein n=3 Tax=Arion vulgaris TaxID=1028688 RepID=A0A0B7AXY5_9EUPU
MSSEKTGSHGSAAIHGHGHKPGRTSDQTNKKHGKLQTGASKQNKSKQVEHVYVAEKDHNIVRTDGDHDAAVMHSQDETVYILPDKLDEDSEHYQKENVEKTTDEGNKENDKYTENFKRDKMEYKKSNVTPENFNVKEFNTNVAEFTRTLDDPRFCQVDSEYPVEDLVSLVNMVTKTVNDYNSDTQMQLTDLRQTMKTIKESLHFSVTRQALDLKADDDNQTQEERELYAKLTHLNAVLAQASADVTEAIRLAAEAETTAVKANIAAERARSEAKRIAEEAEKKEKAENIRKKNERKRQEEEQRQKEEQEKRAQEEKRRIEEEWKRMEAIQTGRAGHAYETWQPIEYEYTNKDGETEITCIARAQPGSFDKHDVIFQVSNEKEELVTYQPNEELISNVVDLTSANGEVELKNPIYVAIPHVLSRSGALSREAVVKAMFEGEWKDLPTRDVTFDNHKVHPIDSATFHEFRTRQPNGKRLLTCSSVVHTQWESNYFGKPIEVTVSCPPNPAKAKKMALARKLKDEKMKNPPKNPNPIEEQEKEKEKENARKRMQEFSETENGPAKVTKWYMGEYGHSEDDETDRLHFVYMMGGKWLLGQDVVIKQLKVDVLHFRLEFPVERFMVLRTRTSLEEDAVAPMAASLNDFLGKRFVEVVVRQKFDNPCEVALQVTPVSRLDAVVKQLAQKGFESGPAPSHMISLQEGDMVEVGFAGNIECTDQLPEQLIYKSNIATVTYFTVKEENKFRQKEQEFYSGLIQLTRRYVMTPTVRAKKVQGSVFTQGQNLGQGQSLGQGDENQQPPQKEWKQEKLCTIQINIPKVSTW